MNTPEEQQRIKEQQEKRRKQILREKLETNGMNYNPKKSLDI